jgi:PAS domain-containing protein
MDFTAFLVLFTLECGIILLYFSWKVYWRNDILGQAYFCILLFLLALACLTMGYNYLGYLFPSLGPYPISGQIEILTLISGHTMTMVWFLFCLYYSGRSRYLTPLNVGLLISYTVLGFLALHIEITPFYPLITGYPILAEFIQILGISAYIKNPILFILGTLLLVYTYKNVSEAFKHQILFLVAGSCFVVLVLTFSDSGMFPSFNPIGFHFGLTGIIWAFGMLYYDVLTFSPVFREKFFGFVELGLIAINEQYQILDMNPVAEKLLQVSLPEVFGKKLSDVPMIPDEFRDALVHPEILQNSPHISLRFHDENRWYKVSVQHDSENIGVSGVNLMVITDISQSIILEKQVSEAKADLLKEKEKIRRDYLYKEFFKTFRDPLFIISDGLISDCNLEALQLFGKTREEIIGTDPCLLSAPVQSNTYDVPDKLKYQIARATTGEFLDFSWVFLSNGKNVNASVRLNRLILDEKVIIVMNIRDMLKDRSFNEVTSSDVISLRNTLAYEQHMWNQVLQIIRKNPDLAGMRDKNSLEEIVQMARENLKKSNGLDPTDSGLKP